MTSSRRLAAPLVACLALVSVTSPAQADTTSAELLYQRGRALMAEGQIAQACGLLAESYAQEKALGTLLNLALCHEREGKLATAWAEFSAAEAEARAAGLREKDRAEAASEHATALAPKRAFLELRFAATTRELRHVVKVDGEPKGELLWDGIPTDPGTRVVEVSAAGKRSRTYRVEARSAERVVVRVEPLEDLPPEPRRTDVAPTSTRGAGFVVGGAGFVVAAVGGVFALFAASADSDAASACRAGCVRGSPEARASDDATDRALLFANVANVAVPLGVLGLGIGTWLVLRSPSKGAATVSVAPGLAGARVGVSF